MDRGVHGRPTEPLAVVCESECSSHSPRCLGAVPDRARFALEAYVVTNGRGSRRRAEQRSLELVQRMIISALVAVVFGSLAVVLAAYLAVTGDQDLPRSSVIGLWVMTGVIGLLTAAAVLMINRRRPYSPLVALGLLPMLVVAYWIFT